MEQWNFGPNHLLSKQEYLIGTVVVKINLFIHASDNKPPEPKFWQFGPRLDFHNNSSDLAMTQRFSYYANGMHPSQTDIDSDL